MSLRSCGLRRGWKPFGRSDQVAVGCAKAPLATDGRQHRLPQCLDADRRTQQAQPGLRPAESGGPHAALRLAPNPPSQPEHEQHGLVALLFQLRREHVLAERDAAQARQDRHILLAAGLERHRRRVEAGADIDLPQLLHAGVVERHRRCRR